MGRIIGGTGHVTHASGAGPVVGKTVEDRDLRDLARRNIIDRMPVVFRYKGFRFFFYSNEGSPREHVHVHVRGEGGEAKFWLKPAVRVAMSDGLDARTLRELAEVVEQNVELIERTWHEYFR